MTDTDEGKILVRTGADTSSTRGGSSLKALSLEELSAQLKRFLEQLDSVLRDVPDQVAAFQFDEFEVSAEVTAKGSIAIVGIGGEAGATGGLKFTFRRGTKADKNPD